MEKIVCGRIVTPFRVIEQGMMVIQDDRIIEVSERSEERIKNSAEVHTFDEPGQYIVPGFVDIHCHGGGGVFSYEDPGTFAAAHLQTGTTSILPTLVYNQTHEAMMTSLKTIRQVMENQSTSIVGIHMEGPYINPKYGAITAPIRPVNVNEYQELLNEAGDLIKLWTLAPELEGQRQFMEDALKYGMTFSVGHSEASPETIFESVPLGLRIGCHLTNASGCTPNQTRYDGTREVGVHEAVMLHDDMFAEVIPDQEGIHVRPLMLRLILKTKGADKVIIITDAMDQAGVKKDGRDVNMIPKNEHTPGDGKAQEMLSGSLLTMNRAVHNMRNHTGIGWVDTCKMASLNPAKAIGLDAQIGSLEKGKKANVLVVSERIDVQKVMLHGEFVK